MPATRLSSRRIRNRLPKVTDPGSLRAALPRRRCRGNGRGLQGRRSVLVGHGGSLHPRASALAEAGCRYVQIDETAFAKFGDPDVQAMLAARGDDWSALIDNYIDVTNRILRAAPCGSAHRHASLPRQSRRPLACRRQLRGGRGAAVQRAWRYRFTFSNTTRRAPAVSRRCALCPGTNRWCSGSSRRKCRSSRTRRRCGGGSTTRPNS